LTLGCFETSQGALGQSEARALLECRDPRSGKTALTELGESDTMDTTAALSAFAAMERAKYEDESELYDGATKVYENVIATLERCESRHELGAIRDKLAARLESRASFALNLASLALPDHLAAADRFMQAAEIRNQAAVNFQDEGMFAKETEQLHRVKSDFREAAMYYERKGQSQSAKRAWESAEKIALKLTERQGFRSRLGG
jgi:hypothetical protein